MSIFGGGVGGGAGTPFIYLGTWNATTNIPHLANGVGSAGDYYVCTVAGTVNFGAGNITFSVGEVVAYNGTTWDNLGSAFGSPVLRTTTATIASLASNATDTINIVWSPAFATQTLYIVVASSTNDQNAPIDIILDTGTLTASGATYTIINSTYTTITNIALTFIGTGN